MENELKQYELLCILTPHLEGDELNTFKSALETSIAQSNGKIIHFTEEEKRDLAYPINKQNQGLYLVSHIEMEPTKIDDFSKSLKLNRQILRHTINYLEPMTNAGELRIFKKARKEKTLISAPRKTKITKDKENIKLEEIDKKLDELVGL
jgi:small subunit ribosomal protein S6